MESMFYPTRVNKNMIVPHFESIGHMFLTLINVNLT